MPWMFSSDESNFVPAPMLLKFIAVSIGAFFFWMLSGFKGSFNDFMSRYYDQDNKYEKNYWTGLALLVFIIVNIIVVAS
jgi:hypothetical protein